MNTLVRRFTAFVATLVSTSVGAGGRGGVVELVGNAAAAAYVGVRVATWKAYTARGYAPRRDRQQISKGKALPVWRQATLDRWQATRPGQGRRRTQEEPMRRITRTLVDVIEDSLRRDPLDGPMVYLEADIMADDMERYTPTAVDPHEGGSPARKA